MDRGGLVLGLPNRLHDEPFERGYQIRRTQRVEDCLQKLYVVFVESFLTEVGTIVNHFVELPSYFDRNFNRNMIGEFAVMF